MLKSMTGFGRAVFENPDKKIIIEIRSLNSKQLDINAKIPPLYKEKEMNIRTLISNHLVRGKVEITFFSEIKSDKNIPLVNKDVIKSYINQLNEVRDELKVENEYDLLSVVMRLPESLKTEKEELDEKEWSGIENGIFKAITDIGAFRAQEGDILEKDIRKRIEKIIDYLNDIKAFEKERTEKIRLKIRSELQVLFNDEKIDKDRFEQELIYYIEKLDITEEKVRLRNHCNYFIETIDKEENAGKKLGFISQEIGREINTIGSKANDSNIQRIVVQMKDELEKIKEQLMNVL